MKKYILPMALLILFLTDPLYAQTRDFPSQIESGLTSFENARYQEAILQFRDVIINSSLEKYHGDAYYWIGRSHLAAGNIEKAAQNIDYFLVQYPDHSLAAEAQYQKGRILYLQKEYDKAIRHLNTFIENFPANDYQSNAYFWIGESFYALGHLEKAEEVYRHIVENFPRSYKFEAANYRRSLIDLKRREQELLKLLKISHEEYLQALEDFEKRERTYEQAISSYQRKLSSSTSEYDDDLLNQYGSEISSQDEQISALKSQLQEERDRIADLRNRISSMQASPQQQPSYSVEGEKDDVRKLLELKNAALSLKMYYIEWLQDNRE